MFKGLIRTNDKCIGCNKCVRICSSFGASVPRNRLEFNSIEINALRCINCGACIDICSRNAREYIDDSNDFFNDLKQGEEISLFVAPSFLAKYPNEYQSVLGKLKELGVKRILPVSFGADICTWAYLNLIKQGYVGRISTTCPVVVSYIEHWHPELISKLMPVKSPLMCIATYCRKILGYQEKFAFLGPCIGKKAEMNELSDLVQYNITFPKLLNFMKNISVDSYDPFERFDTGLGSFYPAPGGLADNVKWFLGDDSPVRIISGKGSIFQYLDRFSKESKENDYVLYDLLNCQDGCLEGTAKDYSEDIEDRSVFKINEIRTKSKSRDISSPWNEKLSTEDRFKNLNKQFENLNLNDYLVEFKDRSSCCKYEIPNEEEANKIYISMHKLDEKSRCIDCSACGYETCKEMMIAIYNGFNTRHNCVYSEKEESIYLTKMSFSDQLTNVMNRNAYERKLTLLDEIRGSLVLVVSDVNGLKATNDNEGHQAGDRLIIETSKALAHVFGVENVYRIGGDEFLAILENCEEEKIESKIVIIKEQLKSIGVSTSIGMSYTENYHNNFSELLEKADKEMYLDKERYYQSIGKERRKN